jgi:quinolinate synthase
MTSDNTAIIRKIKKLKKEKNAVILAHLYQDLEIQHAADFCGDSFELAKKARSTDAENIIFCGVSFMAESAKILNPEKHVFIPRKDAGCRMADMITKDDVLKLKEKHPSAAVVCYINSSADTKSVCDMCVTSSNSLKIIKNMKENEIIFVPDKNLGSYIAKQLPEKKFHFFNGFCPVHNNIKLEELKKAKELHPGSLVLVHHECRPEISDAADFVGSTSAIINFVKESNEKSFIIGTEKAIVEKLTEECPEKDVFLIADHVVCRNMKLTSLEDLLYTLEDLDDEVILPDGVMISARTCLDNMMKAGSAK